MFSLICFFGTSCHKKHFEAAPESLDNAHKALDAAVAAAYGWADYTPDMPDEEILRRLLAPNLERAARAEGESP